MGQRQRTREGAGVVGLPIRTTRAVLQRVYGPPDVLEVGSIPTPSPGPGEVLVRVRAASINARDWHLMRGEPRIARLLDRGSFELRGPRVSIRGTDLSGTVEAVGEGVSRWRVGDRVFGEGTSTLADHAVVLADQIALIPTGLGFDEAASLPLAATTALRCLDAADPAPGDSVLVNGASGGVGTFAVQLAKARGLHVTAVVSQRNAALARSLGADEVVDYGAQDFTHGGVRYDVVVDLVGNRALRDLRRAVRHGGALVLSGGGTSGEGRVVGPVRLLLWGRVYGRIRGLRVLTPQASPDAVLLRRVAALVRDGLVVPVIDRRFRLEDAAEAIRYVEVEHARGKVVVITT